LLVLTQDYVESLESNVVAYLVELVRTARVGRLKMPPWWTTRAVVEPKQALKPLRVILVVLPVWICDGNVKPVLDEGVLFGLIAKHRSEQVGRRLCGEESDLKRPAVTTLTGIANSGGVVAPRSS
jgi:hypothetical protein